jgi:polar amino acid transport system substrate-binding protein
MVSISALKSLFAFMLSGLWLGLGDTPALAADVEFSKGSTLEGILKRGELRIGLEVGYMPFEMIDKRSGLRQKEIRHGGTSAQGASTQPDGF